MYVGSGKGGMNEDNIFLLIIIYFVIIIKHLINYYIHLF